MGHDEGEPETLVGPLRIKGTSNPAPFEALNPSCTAGPWAASGSPSAISPGRWGQELLLKGLRMPPLNVLKTVYPTTIFSSPHVSCFVLTAPRPAMGDPTRVVDRRALLLGLLLLALSVLGYEPKTNEPCVSAPRTGPLEGWVLAGPIPARGTFRMRCSLSSLS